MSTAAEVDALTLRLANTPAPQGWVRLLTHAGAAAVLRMEEGALGLRRSGYYASTLEQLLEDPRPMPLKVRLERTRAVRGALMRRALPCRCDPSGSGAALRAWLDRVGLASLADLEASTVLSRHDLPEDHAGLAARTLSELFDLPRAPGPQPLRSDSREVDAHLMARAAASLDRLAAARLDLRAFVRRLDDVETSPLAPYVEGLQPLIDAVVAGRLASGPSVLVRWGLEAGQPTAWRVFDPAGNAVATVRPLPAPGTPLLHVEPAHSGLAAHVALLVLDSLYVDEVRATFEAHRAPPEPPQLVGLPVDGDQLGFRLGVSRGRPSLQTVVVSRGPKGLRVGKLDPAQARRREDPTTVERRVLRRMEWARLMPSETAHQAEALLDLVGHPRVFPTSAARVPVPVRGGKPELVVDPVQGWARLSWKHGEQRWTHEALTEALAWPISERQPYGVIVGSSRILAFEADPAWLRLYAWVGTVGGWAPPESVEALVGRLDDVDAVEVSLAPRLEGRSLVGDTTARLRLESLDDGIAVDVEVQPRPGGRTLPAGSGPAVLRGLDEHGRWTLRRDPGAERSAADALWERLGLPGAAGSRDLDLPTSVALLERLSELGDGVPARWAGPRATVHTVGASSVRMKLSGDRLLQLGGTVEVDGQRLPIEDVIRALRDGRRFVQLDRRRLARLHTDLAERLEAVADASWTERDGTEHIGASAALALDALSELGVAVDAPPDWTRRMKALRDARVEEPSLPEGLNADLRPYQRAGVAWALRLSRWGLGGVLADDMGLGKTVQALAVLLARVNVGPALVVAPTSVVGTWSREAHRFAPSLRIRMHHGADRARDLAHLGTGDVLLTSWGTLVADAALLAGTSFATVVLDEAHAIKNPVTRRAAAARSLKAGFVLALTGTPVENHPTELWSLFRVVAPGLLGTKDRFEERFVRPILGESDARTRRRLARIVQPFLLRRTKAEVAIDLPARTEIVVPVDLTDEEREVYEGLRRAGLGEIDHEQIEAIEVLAVLTRLRQAASHAGLVVDDLDDSSKLRAARRILADLRAAGHKALVFSQFTRLLDVLADQLVAAGARVGRLDGRHDRQARERTVETFQAGGFEVLLLSLQAGGVGLTLTAATYVLHLDPWWNPAVQDQATDRAHRIGQDQPVTVLHLIARDTVDVGIRAMQARKRELVDGLLAGTRAAERMDARALLELVREGGQGAGSGLAAEALWGAPDAEGTAATVEPTTWAALTDAVLTDISDRVLAAEMTASAAGIYRRQVLRLAEVVEHLPPPTSRAELAAHLARVEEMQDPNPSTRRAWRRVARQWATLLTR